MPKLPKISFNVISHAYDGAAEWAGLLRSEVKARLSIQSLAMAIKFRQQYPHKVNEHVEAQLNAVLKSLDYLADSQYDYRKKLIVLLSLTNSIDSLNRALAFVNDEDTDISAYLSILQDLEEKAKALQLSFYPDTSGAVPTEEEKEEEERFRLESEQRFERFTPPEPLKTLLQRLCDGILYYFRKLCCCFARPADISESLEDRSEPMVIEYKENKDAPLPPLSSSNSTYLRHISSSVESYGKGEKKVVLEELKESNQYVNSSTSVLERSPSSDIHMVKVKVR